MPTVNYHEYLASREWALKKRAVQERSGGICERCGRHPYQQTHHKTYERLGNESMEDLLGVCDGCHEYLSAKSDVDPGAVRPQPTEPPADDSQLIRSFVEKVQALSLTAEDVQEFNELIQPVIAAAHPSTALKLAQIKLEANKQFHRKQGARAVGLATLAPRDK